MSIFNSEKSIQQYLEKNWKTIFPNFKLIKSQPNIIGNYSQRIIGVADFLFSKGQVKFIAELKYSNTRELCFDLWHSLKVIGYAKAYELYTGKRTKPVVILKKEIITNDIRHLFYELGIFYITVERQEDGLFFEYDIGRFDLR